MGERTTQKFYSHHLTKSCPTCRARIGSRCRAFDGVIINGTHIERIHLVKKSKRETVRSNSNLVNEIN